jgi:hypothetical protein
MSRPVPEYPDDDTVYLVVNDYGKHGRAFDDAIALPLGRPLLEPTANRKPAREEAEEV